MSVYCRLLPLLFLIGSALACSDDVTPPLRFSPTELPDAHVGQAYEATIAVSGNRTPVETIWVASGELPSGLVLQHQLSANSAEITGIPTEPGEFQFTIGAACFGTNVSGQTGRQHYVLSVR